MSANVFKYPLNQSVRAHWEDEHGTAQVDTGVIVGQVLEWGGGRISCPPPYYVVRWETSTVNSDTKLYTWELESEVNLMPKGTDDHHSGLVPKRKIQALQHH